MGQDSPWSREPVSGLAEVHELFPGMASITLGTIMHFSTKMLVSVMAAALPWLLVFGHL